MRIAHVTFGFWPIRGGADAYLAELWRVLRAAGHEQTVFQAAGGAAGASTPHSRSTGGNTSFLNLTGGTAPSGMEDSVLPRVPSREELSIVEWPSPPDQTPGRRFWLLAAEVALRRDSLRDFDRVITHYPIYALPFARHPGLIGLSHGVTWDEEPARRHVPPTAANRMKKAIALAAFRNCRRFVANDTFFLREMGWKAPPARGAWEELAPGRWFLPNAVDTVRFSPDPRVVREPVILMARNFHRNRGIHLGMEAFARIAGDWPDFRLRIVGDRGDPGYREECEALTGNLGITGRVDFAGPTPWDRMTGEYRSARVSLVPSLRGEGTSLSALESMACGAPVLATRVGGLLDLPCLHADADPAALAAALTALLGRIDDAAHHQRRAVVEGFHLDLWAAAWRRVVESAA